MDYGFVHNGKVYTPNGTVVSRADNAARNRAIEEAELADWRMRPRSQLAYYDLREQSLTTWQGIVIGAITRFRVYRHNRGGRFVSLRARGTNGAEYYGCASYDNGSCIRLRRVQ